jgi:ATP-dependent protease La (LON) substrate-binding domain
MRRDLPTRPNLDHLKKQAKDLLDAHQRGEPEALARIRAAVPSFAKMTDDELKRAPFALHDAQSAIAREYGMKSWNDLREAVAAKNDPALPNDLMRALFPLALPDAVGEAVREASRRRAEATAAKEAVLAPRLPVIAMRNALIVPRAVAPIHVGRGTTLAAIEAALGHGPPTLGVFAQRAPETEDVDAAALHPVGCEAIVHARIPGVGVGVGAGMVWVVLEGLRWIALESLELAPEGMHVARVAPVPVDPGDAGEVASLAQPLRSRARELAATLPGGAHLAALIDTLDAEPLADLIIANLPVAVAEKTRYAAQPTLAGRLRVASALVAGATTRGHLPSS